MKRSLTTPANVLEMTCGQFVEKFLPYKFSAHYTQAYLVFSNRIVGVNFDDWKNVLIRDLLVLLQKNLPQDFLNFPGVGPVRMKTLIGSFQCAGIDLDDIPEYKEWLNTYNASQR